MNRVVAYIRVSTVRQGVLGVSLEEQRRSIQKYAETHCLHIIEWFEEQESAASTGRTSFFRMLQLLDGGTYQGVIVHKVDRSARNLQDWALISAFVDRGVDLHFAHEGLDMRSRGGRLSADIQAVIAADYSRNLREEVKKGIRGRLHQGLYPFGAPLGYLNCGGGKVKIIDPVTGPLVRHFFELYSTGMHSLHELTVIMSECGLRRSDGTPLSLGTLSKMANNSFYVGDLHISTMEEVFKGLHEPLISRYVFDRVKRQLRLRSKKNKDATYHTWLLARRIICRTCGSALIAERQKCYTYYRCHACRFAYREEVLLDALVEGMRVRTIHASHMEHITAVAVSLRDGVPHKVSLLKLRLGQIVIALGKTTDVYVQGLLEKDMYEERMLRLKEEEQAVKQLVLEEDRVRKLEALAVVHLTSQVFSLADLFLRASLVDRRELLDFLFEKISASSTELYIEMKPEYVELCTET